MQNHVGNAVRKHCCTGCGACFGICPQKCIEMKPDDEGFLFPHVNEHECIACGACVQRCPSLKSENGRNEPREVVAAVWNNTDRIKSASGGIAAMIAEKTVSMRKGHVYGCAFDENIVARHIGVSRIEDLWKFQGSKYVQSQLGDVFSQVKRDLQDGVNVTFIGTPCQVQGLKAFLGKDYEGLICVDLICHGTPSPMLFSAYINYLEARVGKIRSYRFRNKDRYSRDGYRAWYRAARKRPYKADALCDPYFAAFSRCEAFRLSCYQCPYANVSRCGDITLGDSASIQQERKDFHPNDAVSAVLINTKAGQRLWDDFRKFCDETPLDLEREAQLNHQLRQPSKLNAEHRKVIYEELRTNPERLFSKTLMVKHRLRYRVRLFIEHTIPYSIRRKVGLK